MLLPYGKRLEEALDPMAELPMALYDAQDKLLQKIVSRGCRGGSKQGQDCAFGWYSNQHTGWRFGLLYAPPFRNPEQSWSSDGRFHAADQESGVIHWSQFCFRLRSPFCGTHCVASSVFQLYQNCTGRSAFALCCIVCISTYIIKTSLEGRSRSAFAFL